jgi:shikimate dehydrogenase
MIRTGLVGYPVSHSLSPKIHAAAFNSLGLVGEYRLYPVELDDKSGLQEMVVKIRNGELCGLNITIPYKQAVIPLLDELTPSAQAIGAVNTIFSKDNLLIGHNTDAPGFLADLVRLLPKAGADPERLKLEKRALVLGAGGAARAVVYGLITDGWNVTLAVRRADVSQAVALIDSVERVQDARPIRWVLLESEPISHLESEIMLIVNTTPVGMSPETEFSPWPADLFFPPKAVVYDVIYNPRLTRLVRDALAAGLQATTGLGMLVEQAVLSFACWTGAYCAA